MGKINGTLWFNGYGGNTQTREKKRVNIVRFLILNGKNTQVVGNEQEWYYF